MPVSFKFNANTKQVNAKMANLAMKQVPFAVAKSLTLSAKSLVEQNERDIGVIFDRPNSFTKKSFFFIPAKKMNPRTIIKRKDKARGDRTPPSKLNYLERQPEGGGRQSKAVEMALRQRGRGAERFMYATPTRDTKQDQYGNVTRARLNTMINQASAKGGKFFIPKSNHPLALKGGDGVFERMAKGKVKKRLHLHNTAPKYAPRLNFFKRMNKYGRLAFPRIFQRELRNAIRTARI